MPRITAGKLYSQLLPYQQEGVRFLVNRKRAILADEPGLGKSAQALVAYVATPEAIERANAVNVGWRHKGLLIVCPACAVGAWRGEIQRLKLTELDITIVSSGKQIPNKYYSCIILDEAHQFKNSKAKRTRFWLNYAKANGYYVYALTGTPAPNNISELYPILEALFPATIRVNILGLEALHTLDSFVQKYCKYSYHEDYGLQIHGNNEHTLPELQEKLSHIMLRRTKEDVLKDLPPLEWQECPISIDVSSYKDELDLADNAHARVSLTVELLKVTQAIDFVRDLVSERGKVVVFGKHPKALKLLRDGLTEFNPVLYTGASNQCLREKAVSVFKKDRECKVFIGQIHAANTAITLHCGGVCNTVVFLSLDYTPATNEQAAQRVHRLGQPNKVTAYYLTVKGTIDQNVMRAIANKSKGLREFYEGVNA